MIKERRKNDGTVKTVGFEVGMKIVRLVFLMYRYWGDLIEFFATAPLFKGTNLA